jgi:predicted transcriptional regulator
VPEEPSDDALDIVGLTADIVSAFVSHNPVPAGEVPGLINVVDSAIRRLQAPVPVAAEPLVPAVSVKRSITPDYLISLEDGKSYKTLKRHLTAHGLTPYTYRAKWGLPSDYPMVAPNYSKARSELAMSIDFGKKGSATAPVAEPKRGRGRPKKAS